MTRAMVQYSYLQVLDFLTTVAFLVHGVQEGNPLVRWAIDFFPTPPTGLLLVKTAALILGVMCCLRGRERLLERINWLFALLIAWNLVALILQSVYGISRA